MEGLREDFQDIQTYGEPQGRKTVIAMCHKSGNLDKRNAAVWCYIRGKASLGYCAQMAGMNEEAFIRYLGANGVSIFQYDDEQEFIEEMNNA